MTNEVSPQWACARVGLGNRSPVGFRGQRTRRHAAAPPHPPAAPTHYLRRMFAAVSFVPRGATASAPMREALTAEERLAASRASSSFASPGEESNNAMAEDLDVARLKISDDALEDDEVAAGALSMARADAMLGAFDGALRDEGDNDDDDGDDDEDRDALQLQPTDIVFVAIAHDDDAPHGDVCVFEPGDGGGPPNVYVHHDFLLSAPPLCCDFVGTAPGGYAGAAPASDPAAAGVAGRAFAAIGTFETAVEIWDLDVIDAAEPACVLGGEETVTVAMDDDDDDDDDVDEPSSTKKKKKKKDKKAAKKEEKRKRAAAAVPGANYAERVRLKKESHRSSVLCVEWNRTATNLLATGSADETVRLWDVSTARCVATYDTLHSDKVQALAWHRKEPHVLLTGGYDQRCVVSDVRGKSDGMLSMPLSADVESCCWDIGNDSCFYASSEDGVVYCFDMRRTKSAMAVVQAHDRATTCVVSALCARGALGGGGGGGGGDMASVLVTASTDKTVRVWDANALASAGSSSAAERGRGKKAAASAASASSAMLLRVTPKVGAVLSVGTCSDDGRLLVVGGSKGVSVVDLTAAHAEAKAAVSQADNGGSSSSDDDSDSDGDGDGEM